MNHLTKVLLSTAIALSLVAFVVSFNSKSISLGSVMPGGEYHSTTTRTFNGTAIANLQVLKSEPGTLGSIIITGKNTGVITLYDATSTVTNTAWATSTLATFPTNAPEGTYTFDVPFYKGLLIEYSSALATSTITYR